MLLKETKDWLKSHKVELETVLEAQFIEYPRQTSMCINPVETLSVDVCDNLVEEGIGTFDENGRFVPNLQHKYFSNVLACLTTKYQYIKGLVDNGVQKYEKYHISSDVKLWHCDSRDGFDFIKHWICTKYPYDYVKVHTRDDCHILQNDFVYVSFSKSF